jgi:uncharacterized membrane protein YeaQ/YmgE (transglycosylase-associated protein family)
LSFLAWIMLGLIAAFVANWIVNNTGQDLSVEILLGIIGAIIGGLLFSQSGGPGLSGLNSYILFVAIVGSIIVLSLYHALIGRRRVV